jgi:hypothetical protein
MEVQIGIEVGREAKLECWLQMEVQLGIELKWEIQLVNWLPL